MDAALPEKVVKMCKRLRGLLSENGVRVGMKKAVRVGHDFTDGEGRLVVWCLFPWFVGDDAEAGIWGRLCSSRGQECESTGDFHGVEIESA